MATLDEVFGYAGNLILLLCALMPFWGPLLYEMAR